MPDLTRSNWTPGITKGRRSKINAGVSGVREVLLQRKTSDRSQGSSGKPSEGKAGIGSAFSQRGGEGTLRKVFNRGPVWTLH